MLKSERLRTILICLALAAGTAALYAPTRNFSYVNLDDENYIFLNGHVNNGLGWQSFRWAFNVGYAANWHPLTWLSLMLDCQLFGPRPGRMHLVNAALHVANSVLLFLALRWLTGRLWPSAVTAALFAWHPLHVESVAWITERKDVLSGLFFILTIWAYGAYARKSKGRPGAALWFYTAALALFALGLMAKPMLVTTPFLLLLLDAWPLGRIDFAAAKLGKPGWQAAATGLVVEKLPFFALSAASCVLTMIAQNRGGAVRSLAQLPLAGRLINGLAAYGSYIEKLFWPRGLTIFYAIPDAPRVDAAVAAGLAIAAVTVFSVTRRARQPYLLVGWLWFLGTLVPVIGVVQVGGQAFADRYAYLPSIGFLVMICWWAADWAGSQPFRQTVAGAAAVAALAACLCLTIRQVQAWRDSGALAAHALEVDPDSYAARSLYAGSLLERGQLEQARVQCEAAVKINAYPAIAHFYLGSVLLRENKFAEAEAELLKAMAADPAMPNIRARLGETYVGLGQPQLAEEQLRLVLTVDPTSAVTHYNLGRALAMEGRLDTAVAEYRKAVQLVAQYPDAHIALAEALSAQGDLKGAVTEYGAALQFAPDRADALNNLAWLLATAPDAAVRDGHRATGLAQRACSLTGNREPLFLGTLAAAQAADGEFDNAVATATKAHDLALAQGNDAVAAKNLELQKLYRSHRAIGAP